MQGAETRLPRIAKIEVVMTGAHCQQGDGRGVRRGAGTRATGQVHVPLGAGALQQRGQLPLPGNSGTVAP